jgi:hypothetical protein
LPYQPIYVLNPELALRLAIENAGVSLTAAQGITEAGAITTSIPARPSIVQSLGTMRKAFLAGQN